LTADLVHSQEIDALEGAGFRVDREAYHAPAAQDGKQIYGITRSALESEGALGERWTQIMTKPEDWPAPGRAAAAHKQTASNAAPCRNGREGPSTGGSLVKRRD
jgi:hypothetical protein